jgi:hypothetical protein
VLRDQGDLVDARQHLERVLAIRQAVLGPEHPETRDAVDRLASLEPRSSGSE